MKKNAIACFFILLFLKACSTAQQEKNTTNTDTAPVVKHVLDTLKPIRPNQTFGSDFYLDSMIRDKSKKGHKNIVRAYFPQSVRTDEKYRIFSEMIKSDIEKYIETIYQKNLVTEHFYVETWPVYYYETKKVLSICVAIRDNSLYYTDKLYHSYMAWNINKDAWRVSMRDLVSLKADPKVMGMFCDSINRTSEIQQTGYGLQNQNFYSDQPFGFANDGLLIFVADLQQPKNKHHGSIFVPYKVLKNRLTKICNELTNSN